MKIGPRRNEYTDARGDSSHERKIGDKNFEFFRSTDDSGNTRTEVWEDVRGGHTKQRHDVKHNKRT